MTELLIGFSGALLGGLVQFIFSNYASMAAMDVELVNNQIDQINRIEALAIDYWHHDPIKSAVDELRFASLVNGSMTASAAFEVDAQRIMKHSYDKYAALDGGLYDLVTGGQFQTSSKKVECDRVIAIMGKCNEMRAFLRKTRRSVFWAR